MKRIATLASVIWFATAGAPLAAFAEHHEAGEKAKPNANSNAQWSEDAKKGQERAAEVKAGATGAATDAKTKTEKAQSDAKATADKAKADAGAKVDAATGDAKAKAGAAMGDANAKAKAKVDATVPGAAK